MNVLGIPTKIADLVKGYREHINPPYTRRDFSAILSTLFLVLALPIMVLTTLKPQNTATQAAGGNQIVFLNPKTLQPVQSITGPEVKLLLTAPWPISFSSEGQVAAASDSKRQEGSSRSTPEPTREQQIKPTGESRVSPSTKPVPAITSSIVLAEDANFNQNVLTISPVTSNPYLATYTFSSANLGTKTIHVRFVSSFGNSATYSNSIQLVSIASISPPIEGGPTPVLNSNGPYQSASLCPDSGEGHDNNKFHSLWDSEQACHYDHEHGQNPFTNDVASTFPGYNLQTLLGGVQIGHTNPSGPMENTHKHGGFKWDVTLSHSSGCAGREGIQTGVNALVSQYHNFGDYSVEFESRIHSALALMRQCQTANPSDYGYIYVVQHVDYGQRVSPYQGNILPYPDSPVPAYVSSREPYFSVHCHGGVAPCDKYPTRESILHFNSNTDSTWISEPVNLTGSGSPLFFLLFRLRDTYQSLASSDTSHPFSFRWMCSEDGGATYSPIPGCKYNNSTSRVHEVGGQIPQAWDNLAGFDTDARVGRVTAQGFVTRFGTLAQTCTQSGPDCHPIKMVSAFTGKYGSSFGLPAEKISSFAPENLPERDIYFCNGQACNEGDPGAKSSGWIGQNN